MAYVSPAAAREAAFSEKPISPKREFEQLIRSIRSIAAKTRVFSGDLIQELIKETESSASSQKLYSVFGTVAQLAAPVAFALVALQSESKDIAQWFQSGTKVGDIAQTAFGATQFGYQANGQRIQQALSQYNTFDQRMQSIIQSIDSAQQRLQQQETEEASNR